MAAIELADVIAAGLCLSVGLWLLLGRHAWSRNVLQFSLLGRAGPSAAAVLGALLITAALVLLGVALAR